ncbi:hypothetical protein FHX37_0512 [Haloactinospora alba]|uniref:Uncharacterized protein n=1 Tax=Haloactinospora alba TaxID=405555 RepID=A0A543NFT1_9ACTN|nr:hypothetical protein [Haloactinospora alba]TQN30630.1 hypothetical protein FHX37_0512 [Haloactinospora alba]
MRGVEPGWEPGMWVRLSGEPDGLTPWDVVVQRPDGMLRIAPRDTVGDAHTVTVHPDTVERLSGGDLSFLQCRWPVGLRVRLHGASFTVYVVTGHAPQPGTAQGDVLVRPAKGGPVRHANPRTLTDWIPVELRE